MNDLHQVLFLALRIYRLPLPSHTVMVKIQVIHNKVSHTGIGQKAIQRIRIIYPFQQTEIHFFKKRCLISHAIHAKFSLIGMRTNIKFIRPIDVILKHGAERMLDFEEELKKFRPSPEIDQVEDNVYKNNLADVTDLLDEMLKEIKNRQ